MDPLVSRLIRIPRSPSIDVGPVRLAKEAKIEKNGATLIETDPVTAHVVIQLIASERSGE